MIFVEQQQIIVVMDANQVLAMPTLVAVHLLLELPLHVLLFHVVLESVVLNLVFVEQQLITVVQDAKLVLAFIPPVLVPVLPLLQQRQHPLQVMLVVQQLLVPLENVALSMDIVEQQQIIVVLYVLLDLAGGMRHMLPVPVELMHVHKICMAKLNVAPQIDCVEMELFFVELDVGQVLASTQLQPLLVLLQALLLLVVQPLVMLLQLLLVLLLGLLI